MSDTTDGTDVTIRLLADAAEAVPILAEWFVAEWEPYYGPGGPGDAVADLTACLNRDEIPLAVAAFAPDGGLTGTAALKATSAGGDLHAGPWLAALLVRPDFHKRGIGTALIEAIRQQARRLGYSELACSTDTGEAMLQRQGWQRIGETQTLRGIIPVYRLGLR